MGQCDEFACYMTQDVARWWLLYSLSLHSPPSCEAKGSFLLAIIRKHPVVVSLNATGFFFFFEGLLTRQISF